MKLNCEFFRLKKKKYELISSVIKPRLRSDFLYHRFTKEKKKKIEMIRCQIAFKCD